MRKREPTVLYFTKGTTMTEEDQKAMDRLGISPKVRNGSARQAENLEACIAVAGPGIPLAYLKADIPVVATAEDIFELTKPEVAAGVNESAEVASNDLGFAPAVTPPEAPKPAPKWGVPT